MLRNHLRSLKKSTKQLGIMLELLEAIRQEETDGVAKAHIYNVAYKIDQAKDTLTLWCNDGFIDR